MVAKSLHPQRLNHINAVIEDFDTGVFHMRSLFGADLVLDLPQSEWHAALLDLGRTLFEFFVPPAFLLNSRYGPHYLGIEYQANVNEARDAFASHGVRIIRDKGPLFFHTHPADAFGVSFEIWDGVFTDRDWPLLGGKMKPAEYWRDEHFLGITGLTAYTVAVKDIRKATDFFRSLFAADLAYEQPRPSIVAHAVVLSVAGSHMELLTPTSAGPLDTYLNRFGEGIYSSVFGVQSQDKVKSYLEGRGIALDVGSAADRFSINPDANLGLRFEFSGT